MAKKKTVMPIICAYCGIGLGQKNGQGETGVTSGICDNDLIIEELLCARSLVKNKGLTWDEAKAKTIGKLRLIGDYSVS